MKTRRLLEIGLIAIAVAVACTPLPRGIVERIYARRIYPAIQPHLTSLSNAVPIALFDVTMVGLTIGVFTMWIVTIRRAGRGRRMGAVGGLMIDSAAIAAALYVWFLCAWGLNYQREPLRSIVDFDETHVTSEALIELAGRDIDALNALYGAASRYDWPALRDVPAVLDPPFLNAQHELALRWRTEPAIPKRSLLDLYFRRVSVDGMTDPFFLETLTNDSLLPFERPFVVAHEWSHLAGYADESEANFIAWLICMRGDAAIQYSAWISLYGTIVSSVAPGDRPSLVARVQPGPAADLRAMRDRIVRQTNPAASKAGYAMYDRFLKANRVEAGVRSYSEVVQLLLGTRFNPDGRLALKTRN